MRVHFVVPDAIDDPARPSGGNHYDRRLSEELAGAGWTVVEHLVAGPGSDLVPAALPDGAVVLVDGLIAPAVLDGPARDGLRFVVLVHLPTDDDRERAALHRARAVIATSDWTRARLLKRYGLPPGAVTVARPGVDRAPLAPGTSDETGVLCVGALAPHKGQDLLLDALARLPDTSLTCTCVGSVERDPGFVAELRRRPAAHRVRFTGAVTRTGVEAAYAAADLLVVPSRVEAFGMVVSEALARGLPVIAADVGGLPEALAAVDGGRRPGLLVPAGDDGALADALRHWLTDAELRADLRAAAVLRRTTLPGWAYTAARVAAVLDRVGG